MVTYYQTYTVHTLPLGFSRRPEPEGPHVRSAGTSCRLGPTVLRRRRTFETAVFSVVIVLVGRPKVGLGIYIYSCHAGELFGFVPVARDEQAFSC